MPADVQDHRDERVVPARRDEVDDALLAEPVHRRLESGVADRLVAEQLGTEVIHNALVLRHRGGAPPLRDRVDDRVAETGDARQATVPPELVLRAPEASGDQDRNLIEGGRNARPEADVLADLLHQIGHLGAVQQRIEWAPDALAGSGDDRLIALALAEPSIKPVIVRD